MISFGLTFLLFTSLITDAQTKLRWEDGTEQLRSGTYAQDRTALVRMLNQGKTDSAFILTAQMLQKAETGQGSRQQIIDSYFAVGQALLRLGSPEFANKYLCKSKDLYEKAGFAQSNFSRRLNASLATSLPSDSASSRQKIRYYMAGRKQAIDMREGIYAVSLLNNIGIVHLKLGQLDSAEFKFKKALDEYYEWQLPFIEILFSMNNNLGKVACRKGEFDRAYQLFKSNYERSLKPREELKPMVFKKRRVSSTIGMAEVMVATGRYSQADRMLTDVGEVFSMLGNKERAELHNEYYQLWSKVKDGLNDLQGYKLMAQKVLRYNDSLDVLFKRGHNIFMDKLLELEVVRAKEELLAREEQLEADFKQRRLFYLLIFIAFLITAFAAIWIIRKGAKQAQTERGLADLALQNAELKREKLKLELKNRRQDLTEMSAQLMLMQNLSTTTKEKLKDLKELDQHGQASEIKELSNMFSTKVNESRVKNLLKQHLDEVNNDFYAKLDQISGGTLTKAEMEICALQRLRLDDNQIAELRGTTINAVHVARYRIRRKLRLLKTEVLDIFLVNI